MSMMKRANNWLKGQTTSGNSGFVLMLDTVEHALGNSQDWTVMANILHGLSNRPADLRCAKAIYAAATRGITAVKSDSQPSGMVFKAAADRKKKWGDAIKDGDVGFGNKFAELRAMAENGAGFRDKEVQEFCKPMGAPKKDFDLDAYLKRVMKKLADEGVNPRRITSSTVFKEACEATKPVPPHVEAAHAGVPAH